MPAFFKRRHFFMYRQLCLLLGYQHKKFVKNCTGLFIIPNCINFVL